MPNNPLLTQGRFAGFLTYLPLKNPKPYFLHLSVLANQGNTQFIVNYCKSSQNTSDGVIPYTGFQLNSITKQLAILISLIIHNFNIQ